MVKAANNSANANSQLNKVQSKIGDKPSLSGNGTVQTRVEGSFANNAELRNYQAKFRSNPSRRCKWRTGYA